MRTSLTAARSSVVLSAVWLLATAVCLTSCATTTPSVRQFGNFFVPPRPASTEVQPIDPPDFAAASSPGGSQEDPLVSAFYANEVPGFSSSLPSVPRPSDAEFLIKRADDYFAAGKRAFQSGQLEEARRDFDRSLEVLLTAPDNLIDRGKLERHADQLVEAIYRYDVDQADASPDGDTEVTYEESPIDDILNMTFPVDPSLRNKVQEQIRATSSQLPLEENDAVVSFINFFSSTRGKKIMAYGLQHSGRYRPLIQRVLSEEGVPQELIYLAQAESGFSPRAISRARCVGVWQFAAFRGKEYGLNQTASTDDRMDPERATRAAAKHLHDLYNHFGDWNLAMAAYNCGPGCVDKAIQRTGYADFWELRRLNVLPKETANYVPAILAMTIIAKNAKDYGLDDIQFEAPLDYDTVELESATHMALIAEAVDRPLSVLRELNPSVLRSVAPAGHSIHVPKGMSAQVQAAFQAVPAARRDSWRVHRLEGGEALADVARRFNTTSAAIVSANRTLENALENHGSDNRGSYNDNRGSYSNDTQEAAAWIAIPVSYPGDRVPVKATTARNTRKPASTTPASATRVATSKVNPAHTAGHAVAANHPAVASHPLTNRPATNHPTAAPHQAMAEQHKPAAKPATKSISNAPQQRPAARS